MNEYTRDAVLTEAKNIFLSDILDAKEKIKNNKIHDANSKLLSSSQMLNYFASMLYDSEYKKLCDSWTSVFIFAVSKVFVSHLQIEYIKLIETLRLHLTRVDCEEMRRYAEEREYNDSWIDRYESFNENYELLMQCEDAYTSEWSSLSSRAIRYANILNQRSKYE